MAQRLEGNTHVNGTISATGISVPLGIKNADVSTSAEILASKMQHRFAVTYWQADGTAVAAAIVPIYTVRGATATVQAIEVQCVDAPSGGDLAFSVDLLVADVGTPTPATILTGTVAYSATQTDCEVEVGTISSASLTDGDMLLVQVAVSGSTGTQGQGLIVTVTLDEASA